MARHREPAREHDRERERRHERLDAVEQPRDVDEREHEREDQRHRHERVAEPRLRHRREVAVEEPPERQLQRVLRAKRERDDAGVDRRERAEPAGDRDPPLERAAARQPAQHDQPEAERADRQRETEEPGPAHDVLRRRRPARAVGVLDRRRRHADAERPHARDDMRVGGDRLPPHGVRAQLQVAHGRDHVRAVRPRRAGEVLADAVQHADRVRQHRHLLVEPQADDRRPLLQLRAERRRRRPKCRVRRRGRRERERDECDEREAPHRCAGPASGERWPKIGATSRSVNSWIETTTITAANAAWNAAERGRNASASGASAPTMNVQPIR